MQTFNHDCIPPAAGCIWCGCHLQNFSDDYAFDGYIYIDDDWPLTLTQQNIDGFVSDVIRAIWF